MAPVKYTPATTTVVTDGIKQRLLRIDAAIEAANERPDDLATLQQLRDAATEVLRTPTVTGVAKWTRIFEAAAKTYPNLGL